MKKLLLTLLFVYLMSSPRMTTMPFPQPILHISNNVTIQMKLLGPEGMDAYVVDHGFPDLGDQLDADYNPRQDGVDYDDTGDMEP